MSHRVAAITAALLASSGLAIGLPVVAHTGGVTAAHAGDDPEDTLTQENPPPPTPTTTAPTPAPPAPPAPTPPAAAPQQPLPPLPSDTLQETQSNGSNNGSGNGSNNSSPKTTVPVKRLTVTQSTTRAVSDTGAIPQGGIQAGGGGTAATVQNGSSAGGILGAGAGLVLLVTGTGLALRRRVGAH